MQRKKRWKSRKNKNCKWWINKLPNKISKIVDSLTVKDSDSWFLTLAAPFLIAQWIFIQTTREDHPQRTTFTHTRTFESIISINKTYSLICHRSLHWGNKKKRETLIFKTSYFFLGGGMRLDGIYRIKINSSRYFFFFSFLVSFLLNSYVSFC